MHNVFTIFYHLYTQFWKLTLFDRHFSEISDEFNLPDHKCWSYCMLNLFVNVLFSLGPLLYQKYAEVEQAPRAGVASSSQDNFTILYQN